MTPGGGGVSLGLGQVSATHPPTHPPIHPPNPTPPPPGGGGGSMPSTHIQVTYKHLIEKPPLAVVRRKDATPKTQASVELHNQVNKSQFTCKTWQTNTKKMKICGTTVQN